MALASQFFPDDLVEFADHFREDERKGILHIVVVVGTEEDVERHREDDSPGDQELRQGFLEGTHELMIEIPVGETAVSSSCPLETKELQNTFEHG